MEISSVLIGQFWSRDLIKKKKKKRNFYPSNVLSCPRLLLSLSFSNSLVIIPSINIFLSNHFSITTIPRLFPQFDHLPFSLSVCLSICLSIYTPIYPSGYRSRPYLSLSHPSLTSLSVLRPFDARARIRTCDLSHCSLMHYQLC